MQTIPTLTRRHLLGGLLILPAGLRAAEPVKPDERDRAVLETFLLAVLAEPDLSWHKKKAPDSVIILHQRTPEKIGMLESTQISSDCGKQPLDAELCAALISRNKVPGTEYEAREAWYKDLKFDVRIMVADCTVTKPGKSKFDLLEKLNLKAQGWVTAWLPAYSADGKRAFARGWFEPSDHGATATAQLEQKDGAWKALWVKLAFYA